MGIKIAKLIETQEKYNKLQERLNAAVEFKDYVRLYPIWEYGLNDKILSLIYEAENNIRKEMDDLEV